MNRMNLMYHKVFYSFLTLALGALFFGCVQNGPKSHPKATAPLIRLEGMDSISRIFAVQFPSQLELDFQSFDYNLDPNLKDYRFGMEWQISKVTIAFHHALNAQNIFFSLILHGPDEKKIEIDTFNIMNLVPKIDMAGHSGLENAEMLLEEFERFGVQWKSHLKEFRVTGGEAGEINRVVFQNNCLEPGKWELILMSKYYQNAMESNTRKNSPERFRKLAHGWTLLPVDFYQTLIRIKNPSLGILSKSGYADLSSEGAKKTLPAEFFPNPKLEIKTKMVELGLESTRDLETLNEEQFQKRFIHLVDNREDYHTYADIIREPVRFAAFEHEGLYTTQKKNFDFSWMKAMNSIKLYRTSGQDLVRWVDLDIGGAVSPYQIILKNIDLGNLAEGGIYQISFGIDPPPTLTHQYYSRNPNGYKLGIEGKTELVSLLCSNQKSGLWKNNQDLGLEKLMLQWESPEKKILWVYLISFERMIPVWMGRVKIEDPNVGHAIEPGLIPNESPGDDRDASIAARRMRDQSRTDLSIPDTVDLDFEDLRGSGLQRRGYKYVDKGFELTSSAFMLAEPFYSRRVETNSSSSSIALINGSPVGINVLKKIARIPSEEIDELHPYFGAISIRLVESLPGSNGTVTFVGVLGNETKVVQTFILDGHSTTDIFRFDSRFQNIKTLRWYGNSVLFDNILVANRVHASL